MSSTGPSILGISFDGLGISGIVNEFLNVANVLRSEKFRVLLDLGYDITIGRTVDLQNSFLPNWVEPIRCVGRQQPERYGAELIEQAYRQVVEGIRIADANIYDDVCRELASSIVTTLNENNVRFLIIENGTLPDNPIFTDAVYLAIAEYGVQHQLEKYVMWRDHDLMWSAEPHLYGPYPYPGVRKPFDCEHIRYVVASEWMRRRMQAWAPDALYNVIPNRFFLPELWYESNRSLREAYGIPEDAYLIARCTRVIPQKTIERDMRLLYRLQQRFDALGDPRKVFLFVTGPTQEAAEEFQRLTALEETLSISGQVIWGDGLLPLNPMMIDEADRGKRFSICDLLHEADISSFLTSFDYEGFGNPPGEAMATGVPFISTTYELYQEVYGSKGAIAPLLPIARDDAPSDPIPTPFLDWTSRLLTDANYRGQVTRRNLSVCRRFFSLHALRAQLHEIFGEIQ